MDKWYTYEDGVYKFPKNNGVLELRKIQRDKYGRLWADARITVTSDDTTAILALDHGDLTSGRWRSDFASQAAKRNSKDPIPWENLVIEAVDALFTDPDLPSSSTVAELVPAPEFVRTVKPQGPTLVDRLLESDGVYGLVSKPKTGKSVLVLNLALSVTQGGTWLDRRVTSGGMVALFQLEDSERTIKRRLEAMASLPLSEELLIHARGPFRLTEENYDATVTACNGCSLVIVDPIIQGSEVRDWNAQGDVRAAYDLWRRLAREVGATVVILAHHRKMSGDYGDQIAGSIQAQATLDGILELRRDPSILPHQRRLSFIGRDWEDLEDQVLELDPQTLIFRLVGNVGDVVEEVAKERFQPELKKLKDVLPSEPPGLTYGEIEDMTGFERRKLYKLMKLIGDEVKKSGKAQSKKDPLKFWLPEESSPTSE